MSVIWRTLVVMSVVGALFAASPAEARFGKRTDSNDDDDRESSSSRSESSDSSESHGRSGGKRYHEAVPAGSNDEDRDGGDHGRGWRWLRARPRCVDYACSSFAWTGYGYYPYVGAPLPDERPQGIDQSQVVQRALVLTAGANVQAFVGGATGELNLLLEGKHWGFGIDWQGIAATADDGSGGTDSISLFAMDLSYAVLASPHGRIRLEGGVNFANAPDATFIGPHLGISGGVALIGTLNAEGALRITPFPHGQVDLWGGLALGLGPVGIRAGYKRIFLDDRGIVDGVVHTDVFKGPYFGLALSI